MRTSPVFASSQSVWKAMLACSLLALASGYAAGAQGLAVTPVNIQLAPGQKATSLTVVNKGATPTSVQVRAYAWSQPGGEDDLKGSEAVLASPPIATIAPGGSQIVRLVLRHSPEGQEETYRVILDQLPGPPEPGQVNVVLRMSIPVFAEVKGASLARVRFSLDHQDGKTYLVARNDSPVHETLHDLKLSCNQVPISIAGPLGSPYILAGVSRRWPLASENAASMSAPLKVTAQGVSHRIDEQVALTSSP